MDTEKKNKPVGFFKTFGWQFLIKLPIVGIVAALVLIIVPKTNKNIKSLALSELVFHVIGLGLLLAFFLLGGFGYIMEWIDVGLGLHLFGL